MKSSTGPENSRVAKKFHMVEPKRRDRHELASNRVEIVFVSSGTSPPTNRSADRVAIESCKHVKAQKVIEGLLNSLVRTRSGSMESSRPV